MRRVFWLAMLGLLLAGLVLIGSYQTRPAGEGSELVRLQLSVFGSLRKEMYNASGVTLKQLLELKHNISFRGRLRCVDGVCDSGGYWWHSFVNNQSVMQGIESYKVSPGDVITLRFE